MMNTLLVEFHSHAYLQVTLGILTAGLGVAFLIRTVFWIRTCVKALQVSMSLIYCSVCGKLAPQRSLDSSAYSSATETYWH